MKRKSEAIIRAVSDGGRRGSRRTGASQPRTGQGGNLRRRQHSRESPGDRPADFAEIETTSTIKKGGENKHEKINRNSGVTDPGRTRNDTGAKLPGKTDPDHRRLYAGRRQRHRRAADRPEIVGGAGTARGRREQARGGDEHRPGVTSRGRRRTAIRSCWAHPR